MARQGMGPGIDALKGESDRKLRRANDGLDAVRRAKREASERTTSDVHRGVLERAKTENWTGR